MIPLCHKCFNAILIHLEPGVSEFVGCEAEPRIKEYYDAKRLCPVLIEIENEESKDES
jgi:hypothetical protein